MDTIRILYVNGGILNRGGIESYMMNYYRHLDRRKVQIDFIVHGFEKGAYDDEIILMGGKIYHIPVKSRNFFGNIKALRTIFISQKYHIVHSHMDSMSMFVLRIAKKCGVPIRISHSHNTQHLTNNKIKYFLNEYARKNIKKYATHLFACSEEAGRWLYGNAAFDSGRVMVIKNAIDYTAYRFDENERYFQRKKFNLENNFVIGHIGRFDYQKNHIFLLKIFSEILKYISNAKLILVGDGHLREEIKTKIMELGISDSVVILGSRSDVNLIINSFDLFLFPSLFEGLGISLIEAQTNGLQCFISDVIPKEADILKRIVYISLDVSASDWAKQIVNCYDNKMSRKIKKEDFVVTGYEIENAVQELQNKYIALEQELL